MPKTGTSPLDSWRSTRTQSSLKRREPPLKTKDKDKDKTNWTMIAVIAIVIIIIIICLIWYMYTPASPETEGALLEDGEKCNEGRKGKYRECFDGDISSASLVDDARPTRGDYRHIDVF